jgi:hypothetical protein
MKSDRAALLFVRREAARRPYIPLPVRIEVAYRQAREAGATIVVAPRPEWCGRLNLTFLLYWLFGDEDTQLDHDPALGLRDTDDRFPRSDPRHWIPNANDPDYLIYRKQDDDHRVKTYIRGEHGARSDISEMKRRRRIARKKLKPKRKWSSRPFQKRKTSWPKTRIR